MNFTENFRKIQEAIERKEKMNLPAADLYKKQFHLVKAAYEEYNIQMGKSDFANSFAKYTMELNYLAKMKEIAIKAGIDIKDIEQKETEIKEHIKDSFGFTHAE